MIVLKTRNGRPRQQWRGFSYSEMVRDRMTYLPMPDVGRVIDLLEFDPDTGLFRWKRKAGDERYDRAWNKRLAGKLAGNYDRVGYLYIGIDGQKYAGHRLAWLIIHGDIPDMDIDHKDGDRSNNRIRNLRLASDSQNQANMKLPCNNTSGCKGVSWHKSNKAWQARIIVGGKKIHLGSFPNKSLAIEAYVTAARSHHGEYARPY
ncbi:MAG: HNH endonuclease [Shinella sp.]|nr:HNH endonuclease [Shinella sp.]